MCSLNIDIKLCSLCRQVFYANGHTGSKGVQIAFYSEANETTIFTRATKMYSIVYTTGTFPSWFAIRNTIESRNVLDLTNCCASVGAGNQGLCDPSIHSSYIQ